MVASLTERERQVLEAVIETYVQTAEPAGSRTVSRRRGLALSAATSRNTMRDLEAKGYLYHPHTSAGRIPTDLAYRVYVDSLMHLPQVTPSEAHRIRRELGSEIRGTLSDRLRAAVPQPGGGASALLNIFIQEADELFDLPAAAAGGGGGGGGGGGVLLGSAQLLAGQPEFATKERLQGLMEVTERRDLLREALATRLGQGLTITIGSEHQDPKLAPFTLVTASYRLGPLAGVIGVMGPTRMPYDKIVALVDHTSRLVGELFE